MLSNPKINGYVFTKIRFIYYTDLVMYNNIFLGKLFDESHARKNIKAILSWFKNSIKVFDFKEY